MPVSEQTESYADVDRQTRAHLPVVLNIRLRNLIAIVVPQLCAVLGDTLQGVKASGEVCVAIVVEKIRECVAGAGDDTVDVAHRQKTLSVASGRAQSSIGLIFLRQNILHSKS